MGKSRFGQVFAIAAVFALTLTSAVVYAQTIGGTISGTVRDPSKAVVPVAKVSITNTETGITRGLTTNSDGYYQASNLQPGHYEVSVAAAGFSTELKKTEVTVGAAQVMDFDLKVGNIVEVIEVSTEAPTVDLASSTIAGVVDTRTINELPLNGRDWTQLATLQGGVVQVKGQHSDDANKVQRGNGLQLSISGGRPSENNYRLNGITINDYANTGPGSTLRVNLGVDAIQEFSVLTDAFPAQYGRSSGGIINAVTRSGTKAFHGTAYEFLRNNDFDASPFAFPGSTVSSLPFHRNQFGGSLGGPIRKDRTFFFVDYEGLRESLSTPVTNNTISDTARTGAIHTFNPTTQTCTLTPVTVDPTVQKALGLYPHSSVVNGGKACGDTATFSFAAKRPSHENFVIGKLDQKFTDKDSFNASYMFDDAGFTNPDEYNNKALGQASRRQNVTLEESHIFNSGLLNTARGGFSRTYAAQALSQTVFNPLLADPTLGFLPGFNVGLITISGSNLPQFSGGKGAPDTNTFWYNSFQGYDDVFLTKGKHGLKFGFAYEHDQDNWVSPNQAAGVWTFSNLQAFLTNSPTQFASQLPISDTHRRVHQSVIGSYIQDDWRVRQNLTLNLGLRWEMSTVPTEVNGKTSNLLNPTDPAVYIGQLFQNPTKKNFEPRIGASWDPFGTGKTAVRAAYGIFDDLPLAYIFVNRIPRTPPFYEAGTAKASNVPLQGAFPGGGAQFLTPTTFRTAWIQQNPARAYKMEWNLNIQREITHTFSVMIGYVGSHGVHLPRAVEDYDTVQNGVTFVNGHWTFPVPPGADPTKPPTNKVCLRINCNFSRIAADTWDGVSFYDALLVVGEKRMGHGLQAHVSFTWSKSIDDSSVTFSDNEFIQTVGNPLPFVPSFNRGLSDFNVGRALSVSLLYNLPSPQARIQRGILGGWQLGSILTVQDGNPFTAVLSSDQAGNQSSQVGAQQLGERPDMNLSAPGCNGHPTLPGNVVNYINGACFSFPAPYTLGNEPRNALIGPGLLDLDFSLYKNASFRLKSEKIGFQFRAEAFNVLNHPNFALPTFSNFAIFDGTGALIPHPGQLNSIQGAQREIQLGIKFTL